MSPAAVSFHLTFSLETVAVVIGSDAEVPPRVLQMFCPYIGQSPPSAEQLSAAGGAAASAPTCGAVAESSPLPVQASGEHASSTAGSPRALSQSLDLHPLPGVRGAWPFHHGQSSDDGQEHPEISRRSWLPAEARGQAMEILSNA